MHNTISVGYGFFLDENKPSENLSNVFITYMWCIKVHVFLFLQVISNQRITISTIFGLALYASVSDKHQKKTLCVRNSCYVQSIIWLINNNFKWKLKNLYVFYLPFYNEFSPSNGLINWDRKILRLLKLQEMEKSIKTWTQPVTHYRKEKH